MNFQLICDNTPGLCAAFSVQAQDDNGNPFPATGTATIDRYTAAFLVQTGANGFQIKPRAAFNPGLPTETITVTFNMIDSASGNALPPFAVAVDLVAPPAPNQKATKIVQTVAPFRDTGSAAADPGAATIGVSLS